MIQFGEQTYIKLEHDLTKKLQPELAIFLDFSTELQFIKKS